MKTYKPECGDSIVKTAQVMVEMALPGEPVMAVFNGIEVTASFGDSADKIVQDFWTKSERRHEEYINSPEYKEQQQQDEERKVALQLKLDALLQKLPSLNFADVTSVLDWLCELQEPTDHIGTVAPVNAILARFALKGYYPNVNTGANFKKDDGDNYARYIIGQALENLTRVGSIHGFIHHFTAGWKLQFGK